VKYSKTSTEARFLRGDPEAVGTVSRWISIVLTDLRFWRLQEELLDLHQEAIFGLLTSLRRGHFDPDRDFRAYVQAVARYTLRLAARQRRRRPIEDQLVDPSGLPAGSEDEAAMLRAMTVRKALGRLHRRCRELLASYYFEQLDYEQIASNLGIPVGTVKSRLSRCLEMARGKFEELMVERRRNTTDGTRAASPSKGSLSTGVLGGEPTR
jgi:RNA polymerase sigma-70 factor (ECF subfamily)